MVLHFARGSKDGSISDADLQRHLVETLTKLGKRERVCLVPPDYTRFHSNAGILTQACYEHYGGAVKDIMPALGTHAPITDEQRIKMFGEVPKDLFRVHDWRNDVVSVFCARLRRVLVCRNRHWRRCVESLLLDKARGETTGHIPGNKLVVRGSRALCCR